MKNIDKYFNEIKSQLNKFEFNDPICIAYNIMNNGEDCNDYVFTSCRDCGIAVLEWLSREAD